MYVKPSEDSLELEPIPPEKLEIASLKRGLGAAGSEGRGANSAPTRLNVGLYRGNLGVWKNGGYFTLKMLLARALRRNLKAAIIEVDDAAGEAPAETMYTLSLEPADPAALARATKTVNRVLRSRRWRQG
jgi:hypothetical protein